jgi:flagellin
MVVRLKSNIASLNAQRHLGNVTDALRRSFERLSSGLRINRASDDAAGLAIAENLRADSRIYTQGIRNINDGVSMLNIEEGALTELRNIVIRQQELAEQSANGVLTFAQRKALTDEANALVDEFNRIVETTEFNGRGLLTSPEETTRIQAGFGENGGIGFILGEDLARASGTGTFQSPTTGPGAQPFSSLIESGDFDGDGNLDYLVGDGTFAKKATIFFGNGDGTFGDATTLANAGQMDNSPKVLDVNKDGINDILSDDTGNVIYLGSEDRTFTEYEIETGVLSGLAGFVEGDFNGDGKVDLIGLDFHSPTTSWLSVTLLGNGDGTFQSFITFRASTISEFNVADINKDGFDDTFANSTLYLSNGDGTFSKGENFFASGQFLTLADLNNDGFEDMIDTHTPSDVHRVRLGNGDGTFSAITTITTSSTGNLGDFEVVDMNGDGIQDLVSSTDANEHNILFGVGDGTFTNNTTHQTIDLGTDYTLGDFNNDGVADIVNVIQAFPGASPVNLRLANTTQVATMAKLDLFTQDAARDEMMGLEATLQRVTSELGSVGALQSRFAVAANHLAITKENYDAAASRIQDVDVAIEAANLTRNQILQQAASAVLAQANQLPSLALRLLSG